MISFVIIGGMGELQIKAQSWPARCEICHQTDRFDAEQDYCARCAEVRNENPPPRAASATKPVNAPLLPLLAARCGHAVIFLLVSTTTTFWGVSIGMALAAIFNMIFHMMLITMVCILLGAAIGLVWGMVIGYRAVMGRYKEIG